MKIQVGDKFVAKNTLLSSFGGVTARLVFADETFTVVDITGDTIRMVPDNGNTKRSIVLNASMVDDYFAKYDDNHKQTDQKPKQRVNKVTSDRIAEIIEQSEFEAYTVFDKCTIVACKLPNGFVITESSACVDPENYDEDLGIDLCLDKIQDKIWELEGYMLQNDIDPQECKSYEHVDKDDECCIWSDCAKCPYTYECKDDYRYDIDLPEDVFNEFWD